MLEEVEHAMKFLKNGKSPGMDNVPAELIKHSGPNSIKVIHKLCDVIWRTNKWPKDWKQQELIMLFKGGDSQECGNYRTIALLSHASKILLYIIRHRLKQKITTELAGEQAVSEKKEAQEACCVSYKF